MPHAGDTGTATATGNRRRRLLRPLAVTGGALTIGCAGLYVAGLSLAGDEIGRGTTVRGVDLGGMDRDRAGRALDRAFGPAAEAEAGAAFAVRVGDRVERVRPSALGLSLDSAATAARAARAGSDPVTVLGRLFGPDRREVEPVVRMDEGMARAALDGLGEKTGRAVVEGAISFEKGKAKAVVPVSGVALRTDGALDALRAAYPRSGSDPVELPVRTTEPRIGARETERALKEFAGPAVSAPVTLTLEGRRVVVDPAALARHLAMKAGDGGRLVPDLDAKALLADPALAGPLREAAPGPVEARLRLDGPGRVSVAEDGRAGRRVTERTLGEAVLPLLVKSGAGARTGAVATEAVQPKLTRQNVAELGIKEEVSSFTVDFPVADYRTTNIGRAAELINGSVVLPDEIWSFNRTVGERTKENGFVDGIMINGGQYEKAAGGGVSAVATTVFNAVFFAGVKPVEYGAHSFYIERYPEGREATVAWGSLDQSFRNDSGKALYIQASATDTSVTITFLGTKKYDAVKAVKGPRTNVEQPGTRTGSGARCEAQTPLEGFDVTVDRIFEQGGKEVGREKFRTRYTPRDTVTCG
ncbi:VanW family protein [Streptomyces sp. NPDC098789]|uniref:VanW family protein n=1 Tax=Streptomyces sp. NPDC098789 TaxID=3366098 RepID=UPI0037FFE075